MLKAGEVYKTLNGHRFGTQSGRDIITGCCCYPAIATREFDWCAYHDGDEKRSHMYGFGKTEIDALADLRRLDQERYEYEHETAQLEDEQ